MAVGIGVLFVIFLSDCVILNIDSYCVGIDYSSM